MKKLIVVALLLSCATLVGCNPITMKITASEDLSSINVDVEGISLEDITMEEDGSISVNFDNPGDSAQTQEDTADNTSTQTPVVLESTTKDTQEEQNTATQNPTTDSANSSTDSNTDSDADSSTTAETSKDAYSIFKEYVKLHLTDHDNIHSIEFNPEAVDFSFVSSVNNDWARVDKAIVVKNDTGRVFLVISYDEMSADYATDIYEVSEATPTYCVTKEDVRVVSYDPNTELYTAEVTINAMGTYWASMDYVLDDNGDFLTKGSVYSIDSSYNVERHSLTVTKELPVWIEGGSDKLQVGTQILITGTNNSNEMYFSVVGTGECGTITYERTGEYGQVTIDGVSEAEYFEFMPYSG